MVCLSMDDVISSRSFYTRNTPRLEDADAQCVSVILWQAHVAVSRGQPVSRPCVVACIQVGAFDEAGAVGVYWGVSDHG